MKITETINAHGHENILATNEKTFEITKGTSLTKRGDCIIAVAADKNGRELHENFKEMLTKPTSKLMIIIQAGGEMETLEAWGDTRLTLSHPTDLVVRRSTYICARTLAIKANKVANDFSRELVTKLKNPQQGVTITLIAQNSS